MSVPKWLLDLDVGSERTWLQEQERLALCGDRAAVLRVVSGLRVYREEFSRLVDRRWRDGTADGASVSAAMSGVRTAEGETG